jgi:large subunit ribosomal protein L5
MSKNLMERPRIRKVTVNIGVGKNGERLKKAEKVLGLLTNRKPVRTLSKVINKDWGIRKGVPIGCKVTLRGKEAENFLQNAFRAKGGSVAKYSFDSQGNLSFGVADYTDFEGQKYKPEIGTFGMDISITLEKPGYRVKYRRRGKAKIPNRHQVGAEEAMNFLVGRFNLKVV